MRHEGVVEENVETPVCWDGLALHRVETLAADVRG